MAFSVDGCNYAKAENIEFCEVNNMCVGENLSKGYEAMIYTIMEAINEKDHYTFRHSNHVADYAKALATEIGVEKDQVQIIYEAGLVHDVGKLAIPEQILSKPGSLTQSEYKIMQGHVESAVEIIKSMQLLDAVIPAAVAHHERWDGKGYPRGTKGEEIQLGGRCLALADAYDAMVTCRSYKKAYSVDYALQQIRECAGTQFDPNLAEIFVQLVERGSIQKTMNRT